MKKLLLIIGFYAVLITNYSQVQLEKEIAKNAPNPLAEDPATNKIYYLVSPSITNVVATLKWRLATNWVDSGVLVSTTSAPNDQRVIENGIILSNLVATIMWKGRTNEVVIEAVGVSQVQRTFKWQQTKVYQP